MTTETFPANQPEFGEDQQYYHVEVLAAYDEETAAGIGRLMPQLDETFSGDPTPQEKLERIINTPGRAQLVGRDEQGNVVAAATMNTLVGEQGLAEGWLEDFIVDDAARGSGLAADMYGAMGEWCREQGLGQFSYGTETWRPGAIKFYEKNGAKLSPDVKHAMFAFSEQASDRHPSVFTTHDVDSSEDHGTIILSDATSGRPVATVNMNVLMGAGKQSEGWFDNLAINPEFAGAVLTQKLWTEVDGWCRARELSQCSFASADPAFLQQSQDLGAEVYEGALHYTQSVEPAAT